MSVQTSVAKLERSLKWERVKMNKVAQETLRTMVYAEMRPIVEALIEKAKTGDHKTAELLFDRTFGKVKESLELSGEVKFSLSNLAAQWEEQKQLEQHAE